MTSWTTVPLPAAQPYRPAMHHPCTVPSPSTAPLAVGYSAGAHVRRSDGAALHATTDAELHTLRGPMRLLQDVVVHGSVHAALAMPAGAILFDLYKPLGPSWLNPIGRVDTDAPIVALFALLISNGLIAPLVAQAVQARMAAPSLLTLARARDRRHALWHGVLGAGVALAAAALCCARLREEIACREALAGWENGAFANCYYWRALSASAHLCLPLAALVGFHAAGHLRAGQLLRRQLSLRVALDDVA